MRSYPFRNLDVQHEEVHMLLAFVQCQLLCYDGHQHGSAGYTLKPTTNRAVSVIIATSILHQPLCKNTESKLMLTFTVIPEFCVFITLHGKTLFRKLNVDVHTTDGFV